MTISFGDINTKDEFVRIFSEKTGWNLSDSHDILDAFTEIFASAMKNHSEIHLSGLGSLTHTVVKPRKGIKPVPGKKGTYESVEYPEAIRSNFKLSKTLRDLSKSDE